MGGLLFGFLLLMGAFCALMVVLGRMRRQVGGGLGPTEMSDGSITTTPTGYPEEMHGHGKKISPSDNSAAGY
jgi:hypothetical protein